MIRTHWPGISRAAKSLGTAVAMAAVGGERRTSRAAQALGTVMATATIGGGAFLVSETGKTPTVSAAYMKTVDWGGGYTGQYVISNETEDPVSDWTLEFDLPAGTKISSLWNGRDTADGRHITVKPTSSDGEIAPGESVTVGFVATSDIKAGQPEGCLIDKVMCDGAGPKPVGGPTRSETPTAAPSPSRKRTQKPTAKPSRTATASPSQPSGPTGARFAPYIDTSLSPAYDMVDTAKKTGVKEYNLAFIHSGGGCTPEWGGGTDLTSDPVAAQIGSLRKAGGDVRVSFGGKSGSEPAITCSSVSKLAAAYGKVVDAYNLTKVDFDIEGAALSNTAANSRRAQALAALQRSHPKFDVSFTLPAMPSGLTKDGVNLLANAKKNGVKISTVNIMAMDYGSSFSGDMGQYAIDAATAAQGQIKSVLGLSDTAAWKTVAVTPMIGVNDVIGEVFTLEDATQLVKFAESKGLGRLSLWSSTRDKQCPGGAQKSAQPTCSSIVQGELAFTRALGAYKG